MQAKACAYEMRAKACAYKTRPFGLRYATPITLLANSTCANNQND